jgi:hypothetical protein
METHVQVNSQTAWWSNIEILNTIWQLVSVCLESKIGYFTQRPTTNYSYNLPYIYDSEGFEQKFQRKIQSHGCVNVNKCKDKLTNVIINAGQIFSDLFVVGVYGTYCLQLTASVTIITLKHVTVAAAVVKCLWRRGVQSAVYRDPNTSSSYLAHPAWMRFKVVRGQEYFDVYPTIGICIYYVFVIVIINIR